MQTRFGRAPQILAPPLSRVLIAKMWGTISRLFPFGSLKSMIRRIFGAYTPPPPHQGCPRRPLHIVIKKWTPIMIDSANVNRVFFHAYNIADTSDGQIPIVVGIEIAI